MTDLNRNTRTLILSFVIAIFALVPLRFVEIGQQMVGFSGAAVLGEQEEMMMWEENAVPEVGYYEQPDNELTAPAAKLEAPYDEIDGYVLGAITEAVEVTEEWAGEETNCINEDEARVMIEEMYLSGASSVDMQLVANSICQ